MSLIVVWRPPTRREQCSCTECHVCLEDQTMQDAWPLWYVCSWIPKRALCTVIGHQTDKFTGPNQCVRCQSRRITVDTNPTPESRKEELRRLIPLMHHRMRLCRDDEEYRVLDRRLEKWQEELRHLEKTEAGTRSS